MKNGGNMSLLATRPILWMGILITFVFGLFLAVRPATAQTVSLTGTVVEPDGTAIQNAYLYIHDANWYTYSYDYTDSNGVFEFTDLSDGTYTLEMYAPWPWDKNSSPPRPFSVVIKNGETTDLGEVQFKADNVTGKIVAADGTSISGYYVNAATSNWADYSYDSTRDDGTFSLYMPNPGTYTLYLYDSTYSTPKFFSPGNKTFTIETQDQAYDFGTITGKSPNVRGTFRDKNGNVIENGYPYAYLHDRNWTVSKYSNVDTTNGEFEFYVPAGTYTLDLYAWNNGVNPDPISVTVGDSTVNLGEIRQVSPNVQLTIVERDGVTPVTSASASLHTSNWGISKWDSADANGLIEFSVSTETTYYVDVYGYHSAQADPPQYSFAFTTGSTITDTLELQPPAMQGRVIGPDGNGVSGVSISVYDSNNYSGNRYGWGYTDSAGDFSINKALETGTYTVSLYYYSYGNNAQQLITPDDFTISLTQGTTDTTYVTTPLALTNPVKTISGIVKYPNGDPVTDAWVNGWRSNGSGWFNVETGSAGEFSALTASGSWEVSVYPTWTNGSPSWGYFDPAKKIKFALASDVEETKTVSFTVVPYTSTISGTLLNPDGTVPSSGYNSVSVNNDDGGFWSWSEVNSSTGNWSVKVPAGTFNIQVYTSNSTYAAPELQSWTVGDNENLNLGNIYLLEKKEFITVTTVDTNGSTLADQYVYAWKDGGGWGWASGQTNSNGQVTLNVTQGDWIVEAYSNWWYGGQTEQYVPISGAQTVTLTAEETETLTFEFGIANATINGSVQDPDGNIVTDAYGWISVKNPSSDREWGILGASVNGGQFEIKVPAGTWELQYWTWGSDYDVEGTVDVEIADSETVDGVVINLVPQNSTISGQLVDNLGDPITDVSASIYAEKNGGSHKWEWTNDGSYSFNVSAGEWDLGVWINWNDDYIVSPAQSQTLTVADNETVTHNIELVQKDSVVSGTITDENGDPIQNMWVALGTRKGEQTTSSYMYYYDKFEFGARSDQNGNYTITAPSGEWFVSSTAATDSGYMNPESVKVTISPDAPTDVDFVFLASDASVSGTVTLDGVANKAYVYGWSEGGAFSETTTNDGAYTLPIRSGTTWHVGAVYEDDDNGRYYEAAEITVIAREADTTYNGDLALQMNPTTIPKSRSLTFYSDDTVSIELSDGTTVIIPAFAILDETERMVTVIVTPSVEVPRTADAHPIALMYDLTAIYADGDNVGEEIPSFASSVTIEIPYTQAQLDALGVTEDEIQPLYWDSTAGEYRNVNNTIVDTDNKQIRFTVNHFTMFGILTAGTASSDEVLPAVTLTLPPDNAVVAVPQITVAGTVSDSTATVSVLLNSSEFDTPRVSSAGEFETVVTGLTLGDNALSVSATNTVGTSAAVTRTITYQIGGDGDGGDGNGDNGGGDGDDTPLDVATSITKDVVVVPNEGASNIRMFTNEGEYIRSFYAYSPAVRGSYQMLTRDLDGDGAQELLVSTEDGLAAHIRVFDKEGNLITHFFPFGSAPRFGVEMLMSDVTGDGLPELFAWPKGTAGTQLRIYAYDTTEQVFNLIADHFLYGETFRGTMNVTVADVTGDGTRDIIAFPTSGGSSNIRVYNYSNGKLNYVTHFFAYGETVKVGSRVMTGDLDGDGIRDIIVAPQDHSSSNIRLYRYNANDEAFELMAWTMAFGSSWRGELNIRVADMDNDDMVEIVVAPHTFGGPNVRVYEYNAITGQLDLVDWFMAYSATFQGGVDFAVTNLDGDDYSEIVTTPRYLGGPNLRVYEYDPDVDGFLLRDWMLTHDSGLRGQLHVTVTDIQGDGDSELIVSPLEVGMGGPNVRILNWNTTENALELYGWFWGFAGDFRGGVKATTINQ